MANRITYQVGFDIHKQGLNQLKSSLQQLSKMKVSDLMKINASDSQAARTQLNKIQKQAARVEDALQKAFNTKLNTVNIETFNQQLKNSGTSIENIYQTFKKAGATGENAFRSLSSQVLNTNIQLKESHTLLDNMATTLANTVKWNVASSAVNSLSNSIQQAFGYVKDLDTSLNDIRIVTNKTAEDMGAFAEKANEVAQSLGKSTTDYTKAALIYAQQGLNDKQIEERAAITLKTANVTGQSTKAVSEELTAIWNGYKVNADEAELYVDRVAAVAATTAADLEELATGMSKVASAANLMGVSEDQLAAQISTIISVTREAPETVGSALKTIFARINDIKAGVAEDGVTLGRFSGQMAEYGFNILDANGHLRDMGDVIEEIGGKWEALGREQQVALAQIMGGKYQYSRLLSLFDNFGQYNKTLETARNAAGTLQKQQDIYMESTAAHLNTLKAAIDNIYDSFINTDSINSLVDGLTTVANLSANFVDSIGGGGAILSSLGAIGVTVFSQQIAKGLNATITNFEIARDNANQFKQALQVTKQWQGIPGLEKTTDELLTMREKILELSKYMSPQQFKGMQTLLDNVTNVGNQLANLTEKQTFLKQAVSEVVEYEVAWEKVKDVLNNEKQLNDIKEKLQQQEEVLNKNINQLDKYIQELKKFAETGQFSFQKSKTELKEYVSEIAKLTSEGGSLQNHKEQIRSLQAELAKLDDSVPDQILKIKLESIANQIKILVSKTEQATKEIKQDFEKDVEGALDSVTSRARKAGEELSRAQGELNRNLDKMSRAATIDNYAKVAGAIAQVGMSIEMVQNLGSIWKNQDLSTGEKILQTITNLAMTLPMLISGLTTVTTAMGLFKVATYESAAAATAAKVATQGAGTSFRLLNSVITVSNPILLGITAAITAVTIAFGAWNQAIKKNREELIKSNEADIEKQNQIQSEIQSHKTLYSSLEDLDEKYKQGDITRSELKSSVQDLISQYNLEGDAADDLAKAYDNLAEYIKKAREEQAKELVESTKREKESASDNLVNAMLGDAGLFGASKNTKQFSLDAGASLKDQPKKLQQMLKKAGGQNFLGGTITFDVDFGNPESIAEFYEKIQNIVDKVDELRDKGQITRQELNNSEYYQGLKDTLNQLSKAYDEYKTSIDEAAKAEDEHSIIKAMQDASLDFSSIKDGNQYLEQRISLIDQLREKGYADDKAKQMADTYLQANFGDLYNRYTEVGDYLQKLGDKLGEATVDVEKLYSDLNDQQLAALLKMGPETITSWDTFNKIVQQLAQTDFSNISDLKADIESMQENASDNFSFYQSLEDQISGGKGISKSQFKSLTEKNGELAQFFDMMANGTYKMTGDAKEFYELVDSFKLEGFHDTLDAIQKKIESINEISSQNFDYSDLNKSAVVGDSDFINYDRLEKQLDYLEATNGALDTQIESWRELAEQQNISIYAVEQIAQKVEETKDQTQDLEGQTESLKQAVREVQQQLHDAMFPTDADIDTSALEKLSETIQELSPSVTELSEELHENARAAEDVAESILRFDDAVTDVVDNYENWIEALNSGSIQEQAEAIAGLRDAYADLLDLDGSSLSNQFLTNVDNLELMKAAIDGNIDAYDELLAIAGQDIALQIGLDIEDFNNQVDDLLSQYYEVESLDDLEIGARLDDEQFLNGLTNLVNAAGMTAQQATDYLASMGVDAEVIENRTEATEENQTVGYNLEPEQVEGDYAIPVIQGTNFKLQTGKAKNVSFKGVPQVETVTATKENVGFGLKVTAAGKSSGGNFKYTQAKHGGGSAGQARRSAVVQKTQKEADKAASAAQKQAEKAAKEAERQQKAAERQAQQQRKAEQREAEKQRKAQEKAQKQAQKAAEKAAKTAEQNVDTSTKDKKELIKDERDIYHNINIEIKQINRELQRTQEQQDKLYGKDLLNNLNKQTEILEKHKQKLKEKQQLQRYDLAQQKASLIALGATFDAYGNITNYMTVVAQKQNAVNKLVAQYNDLISTYNSSTDKDFKKNIDDQLTAVNKEIQSAEKDLKDAKDRISNYDSLREAIEDITDQVEEETQKEIEINIKKFRMQLQIRLDMREAEKDWNDFQRKVINHTDIIKDTDFSKIFKDAETGLQNILSYYQTESIETLTDQLLNTYSEIQLIDAGVGSAIYGNNEKQAMEDLKGDLKTLMGQLGDIQDLIDSIDQAYLNTIDDVQNQFNKQINDYDYITGLIDHNIDLLTLLYGNKNYDAMQKYYSTLQINQGKELEALKLQGEYWKKQWDEAEARGDTKAAEKFEENYKNVINKTAQLVADAAKTIKNKFTTAIDEIFDDLESKLTNGKNLNYLQMEWNLINKNADEYLDTVNAAFAVQQLEVKFKNALRDTDNKNVKAQKQIKTLMDEQLANLKAKQKLTQYDVDRAAKLLEIEQARIALEESKANKTTMRLKRDSQGNYSYEYVADQGSIEQAQQNLASAQNELYNFDKDRYRSNLEDMLSAYKDFSSKLKEIWEDDNLSYEKKVQMQSLLEEQYGEYINGKTQQNLNIRNNLTESAFKEIASIYQTDVSNYNQMSEDEKNILMGDLIPTWNSGIQQMSDKIAGQGGLIPACENAFVGISEATKEYEDDLKSLEKEAGIDLQNIKNGVDDLTTSFMELVANNEQLVQVAGGQLDAIKDLKDAAHDLTTEYNAVYSAALQAVSAMQTFMQEKQRQAAEEASQYSGGGSSGYTTTSTSSYDSSTSSGYQDSYDYSDDNYDSSGYNGDILSSENVEGIAGNIWVYGSWGNQPNRHKLMVEKFGQAAGDQLFAAVQSLINNDIQYNGVTSSWEYYKKFAPSSFRTGGYTGNWIGTEGKLGLLHQKEMVLNADDTKNLLDTISILRQMINNITGGISARLNSVRSDFYSSNSNNDNLEQNVHIEASFPNVNSKREIEEAFNDLVNLAAQRAMRR